MAVYYLSDVEHGDQLLPRPYASIQEARLGAMAIMKRTNAVKPPSYKVEYPQFEIVTLHSTGKKVDRRFQGAVVDLRDPDTRRHLYYRWIPKTEGNWGVVNPDGTVRRL